MITDDFVIRSWGQTLIRFSHDTLVNVSIPDDAKRFLAEVGLPPQLGIDQFPWANLDLTGKLESFLHENVAHTILGRNQFGQKLCIHSLNGSIVILQPNLFTDFMNSNIKAFAGFLTLFHNLFAQYSGNIPEDQFRHMREIMRSEDPIAFSHTRHTWGVILDEVELALYG